MLSTQDVRNEDVQLIEVFRGAFGKSGMAGTYEALLQLNDKEPISLGEIGGKIISVESLEDSKGIQDWFNISEARLFNYVTCDEKQFDVLSIEAKEKISSSNRPLSALRKKIKSLFTVEGLISMESPLST